MALTPTRTRVQSVDVLRGIVMVIMAIDHIRDFLHYGAQHYAPEDLTQTTPIVFFTRWMTHFCAPVFVFLAGTSAALSARRGRSNADVSRLLLTRGLWLVLIELTVVKVGMSFNLSYNFVLLQVIWALGWSMVVMSALIHLPWRALLIVSVVMVAGHNLLDGVQPEQFGSFALLWIVLHVMSVVPLNDTHVVFLAYPLIPWIGVMSLGYCFARVFELDSSRRRRLLWQMGLAATIAFVVIRFANGYGDLRPWSPQRSATFTILSFLSATKYPPSLDYLLMTLGPALMVLAWLDGRTFGDRNPWLVFGKVPFFYYIAHWYALHLVALVMAAVRYGRVGFMFSFPPAAIPENTLYPPDYGYNLAVVYIAWIGIVALLYPLCLWFSRMKARSKSPVLSYL